jgi:hypothetical protein
MSEREGEAPAEPSRAGILKQVLLRLRLGRSFAIPTDSPVSNSRHAAFSFVVGDKGWILCGCQLTSQITNVAKHIDCL